jgi:membrane-associated phospholipid phosphatase
MGNETGQSRASWERLPFIKIAGRIWHFFGGRLLLGLIAAVSGLLFFMWLASEVFEGETKHFDDSIRQAVNQTATPWLTQLMIFLSFVGSVKFLIGLAIIILIIFFRLKWRRAIILFLITMGGEIILSLTLKAFFQRARPEAFFNYPLPGSFSFPSGHALGSFCFFGILAWLITARLEKFWLKCLIWTFSALLIFFIGVSRIYLGVHFPSDVCAGFTVAFVWISVVAFSDYWFKTRAVEIKSTKQINS